MVYCPTMSPGKLRTTGIHVAFWALFTFALMIYQPLSWGVVLPAAFWIRQILHTALLMALFYANYFYAVPRLLFHKRTFQFICWIAFALLFALSFSYLLEHALDVRAKLEQVLNLPPPRRREWFDGFILMTSLLFLGISTSIAVIQRWQRDSRLSEEFQRQQISAELAYLRAQINPHFFFNTLNSIYALSFSDIASAREALHKLSRMMRYLLYETKQHESSLQKEIDFIKDHMALMRLRLHDNIKIDFQATPLASDRLIAPMLLLPFVENAFKHGVSTTQPGTIAVGIHVADNKLHMHVSNPIIQQEAHPPSQTLEGGIGLANTRRRLELLYPAKHQLLIQEDKLNGIYTVDLTIELQ